MYHQLAYTNISNIQTQPNIKTRSSSLNLELQYISQHVHVYGNISSISKGKQFEGLQFTNIYNYAPKDF